MALRSHLRVREALLVAVLVLATVGVAAPPSAAEPAPATKGGGAAAQAVRTRFVPGEYIVTVADGAELSSVAGLAEARGGRVAQRYRHALTGFSATLDDATVAALRRDPRVVRVDPNRMFHIATTTQASPPWGLDRLDQPKRPLDRTYSYGRAGKGVTAYVVDTGVRADHQEFGGRVVAGFDGTGGSRTADCNGHGTHVAGTIAGRTSGVAKQARVVPVRVLDCQGWGQDRWIIAGLDWVVRHHQAGQPAVANLSLGAYVGSSSSPIDSAVRRVITDGVTVVAAAGNSGYDACLFTPARVSAAITVAATDRNDWSPNWSNFGRCVDLFAPGVAVASAWHTSSTALRTLDGTSMAAPHVAGAAAVYLSGRPTATPAAVWDWMRTAATTGLVGNPGYATPNRLLTVRGKAPIKTTQAPSSTQVPIGSTVTVTATLVNSVSGVPFPGAEAVLFQRRVGTTEWRQVVAAKTDSSGRARLAHAPTVATEYQVRHAGTSISQPSTSGISKVTVTNQVATTASLAAASTTIDHGQSATLTATLTAANTGAAVSGAPLQLQTRRADGSTSWSTVATRSTDATGRAAFSHAPERNAQYRIVFAGTAAHQASTSSAVTVRVRFVVTAALSASVITKDQDTYLSGRVRPPSVDASGRWLELQLLEAGVWHTFDYVDYSSSGDYGVWLCGDPGTYTLRTMAPADAGNAAAGSPALTLTITGTGWGSCWSGYDQSVSSASSDVAADRPPLRAVDRD